MIHWCWCKQPGYLESPLGLGCHQVTKSNYVIWQVGARGQVRCCQSIVVKHFFGTTIDVAKDKLAFQQEASSRDKHDPVVS